MEYEVTAAATSVLQSLEGPEEPRYRAAADGDDNDDDDDAEAIF